MRAKGKYVAFLVLKSDKCSLTYTLYAGFQIPSMI